MALLKSGSQKYIKNGTIHEGAYWRFAWEQHSTDVPGTSLIKWKVYRGAEKEYSATAKPLCYFDIYYNNKKILNTTSEYRTFPKDEDKLQEDGEFIFQHDSKGKGNIAFEFEVFIYSDNYKTVLEIDLLENLPYTKCQAPTSLSLTPSIQKPGGNITLTWDGATGGTANPIKGYKAFYSILGNDNIVYEIAEEFIDSSAPNGKITWTLPNEDKYRNKTIQASIQVVGAISGYDSEKRVEKLGAVNTKPVLAAYRTSKTIVPSTGGNVNFTLYGQDKDNQSLSYYYETDESGKRPYENKTDIFVSDTKTFRFYVYDGLEYSDAVQIKIQKNTEPSCTITTSGDPYIDYKITCQTTGGQDNENKFQYYLSYDNKKILLQDEGEASYLIGDIRAKLGSLEIEREYKCQFWVVRNDGVEDWTSDKINISIYAPTVALRNDLGDQLFSGFPYFSKKVEVKFTNNYTNITKLALSTSTINAQLQIYQFNTEEFEYDEVFSKLRVNDSFDLNLGFNIIKTSAITISPTQGNSSLFGKDDFVFKAYTDSVLYIYIQASSDSRYGFSGEKGLTIKSGDNILSASYNSSSSDETGIRIYSVLGKQFYNTFIVDSNEPGSLGLNFELENKYGDKFSYSDELNINYEALATISRQPNLKTNDILLENWAYLKEGMPLSTDLELYSVLEPAVDFLYKKNGAASWQVLSNASFIKNQNDYDDTIYNARAYKYVCQDPFYTIGANEEDFEVEFGVRVSTGNRSYITDLQKANSPKLKVMSHKPPIIKVQDAFILNSTLTTTFDIENLGFTQVEGISFSKKVSLEIQNSSTRDFNNYQDALTWSLTENEIKSDFLHVSPILKTSFSTYVKGDKNNLYYPTEKTSQSKFWFLVYNIVPTVSYRKNHLGINTLSPSEREDSIVYVGSYGKRDKLYFVNSENKARTIDIESGGIDGFVVDCGSWTGIPGGLVPTNPDLPIGLATIAYTGDIKDLEQKTETIIIISGGSSEI